MMSSDVQVNIDKYPQEYVKDSLSLGVRRNYTLWQKQVHLLLGYY
jgi:hypothetical protein